MTNEKKFAAKDEVKGSKFSIAGAKNAAAGANHDNIFAFILAIGTGLVS